MKQTESIVDYILKSQSSERHFDIQPWEQQIEPCSHSLSLEQQDSLLQRNWSHIQCAKCDQDKNLWVCLTCSHIGCGRAQYGGIAGNSHGLTHFEESGHPISVKFGSITPSGEAGIGTINKEETDALTSRCILLYLQRRSSRS